MNDEITWSPLFLKTFLSEYWEDYGITGFGIEGNEHRFSGYFPNQHIKYSVFLKIIEDHCKNVGLDELTEIPLSDEYITYGFVMRGDIETEVLITIRVSVRHNYKNSKNSTSLEVMVDSSVKIKPTDE